MRFHMCVSVCMYLCVCCIQLRVRVSARSIGARFAPVRVSWVRRAAGIRIQMLLDDGTHRASLWRDTKKTRPAGFRYLHPDCGTNMRLYKRECRPITAPSAGYHSISEHIWSVRQRSGRRYMQARTKNNTAGCRAGQTAPTDRRSGLCCVFCFLIST